jgi:hypothetical protein
MAKRSTGVGSKQKSSPHKTKKRLAIKSQMLKDKAETQKHRR